MLTLYGVAIERPDWWAHAACTGGDTRPWFPERGQPAAPGVAICDTCPACDDCLTYALADPTLTGTWGGTTEAQRIRIRERTTQ